MMPLRLIAPLSTACLAACTVLQGEESIPVPGWPGGHFNAVIGVRQLDERTTWSPVDEQTSFAVTADTGSLGSFAAWDFGLHYSFDDTVRTVGSGTFGIEAETLEVTAGLLKSFSIPRTVLRPYVGAGGSLVYTESEVFSEGFLFIDDDFSVGYYVRWGLLLELRPGQQIGLDVRHLMGTDISIDGFDTNVDATLIGLVFGYSF